LEDYERAFLTKTTRLSKSGVKFEELAREALLGKFGGAAEVLLRDLSPDALANPSLFVSAMSKMFGRGALGIYEPIVKYVDMGIHGSHGSSPVLDLIRQLGPAAATGEEARTIPLHDQRIKDDQDEYADDAN